MVESCARIQQKSPALQLPMAYLYGIIAFTFVLSVIRYIQIMVLKHKSIEGREEMEGGCE